MFMMDPVAVDDSILLASNVPEDDHVEWATGTSYSIGDRVIVVSTHRIYESVTDNNQGNDPVGDDQGVHWLNVSATNRYKAFDNRLGLSTTQATSITYQIQPNDVQSAVMFFFPIGDTIQVVATDAVEGEVYNRQFTINDSSGVNDIYDYFFLPITASTSVVFDGIPPFAGLTYDITITAVTGSDASVAQIVLGYGIDIGEHIPGGRVETESFTVLNEDAFGNINPTVRDTIANRTYQLSIPRSGVDFIERQISARSGQYTAFYADWDGVGFEHVQYGVPTDFSSDQSNAALYDATLEVRGVV